MNQDNNPERAPARLVNHIEINHQGQEYRVILDHYQEKKTNMVLACLCWAEIIIFTLLYQFLDRFYNQKSVTLRYLPLFIQVNVFMMIMLSLALINRSNVPPFNFWSLVGATAYTVAVTILFEKQIACQWIAAIAFSSFEILLAIFCTKHKVFIVPICFLAAQLILVVFQIEGKLSLNWLVVLAILIGITFVQAATALALVIMGLVEFFKAEGYRLFAIETTYLGLVQLGYAVDAASLVLKLSFSIPISYIVVPCAAYNFFLLIFSLYFRNEIILFKSKAALILSQRNRYNFEKIQHSKIMIKSSANWFNPHVEDQKAYLGEQKVGSSIKQQTKCVICLCDPAQMIWLPCGHLTVCDGCGQYLMDNGKLNCVICKTKGEELYHIKVDCNAAVPRFQSDYFYKITVK